MCDRAVMFWGSYSVSTIICYMAFRWCDFDRLMLAGNGLLHVELRHNEMGESNRFGSLVSEGL